MLKDDECIFIISYNRPKSIHTLKALDEGNVKGKIYIVVSDDDPSLQKYMKNYQDDIIVFNKKEIASSFDICDNFDGMIGSVFPRNALNNIAKRLGVKRYCVLDDDYDRFSYRRCFGDILKGFKCCNLGIILEYCFKYLEKTPQIDCFSFAQDGDFIGGADSFSSIGGKRKIMNVFFCQTDKPIKYIGRMNEDVNTYLYYGQRGKLFFTINDISTHQKASQSQDGGMTDLYIDLGTYIKSFYSVIVAPSMVKVNTIGIQNPRIHHKISWEKVCPKLIREIYKK